MILRSLAAIQVRSRRSNCPLVILGRQVRHGGNPVLRWMASNVAVEMDAAGNIKPSKARSTERVDGIVAALMALGRVIATQETGPDRYAEEGFAFV